MQGVTGQRIARTALAGVAARFRVPRVRADAVQRPALAARLAAAVAANPLTLVCAPAGAGKTTLLSQWAASAGADTRVLWISLDADDDDANRLYTALVAASEPLALAWDADPRTLAAAIRGPGTELRTAVGAFVNALCTASAPRLVLVLDDLHRVESVAALAVLEALIERLPDTVALVLGSRVEPRLPLARWRAYGELAEFGPQELRFSGDDARALAAARLSAPPDARELAAALERTQGWAAGLGLWLQARHRPAQPAGAPVAVDASNRQLFAYLAQEILDELPPELRDFLLRTSILAELSPALCDAVTGRDDGTAVLDELYRRNLFLTVLDDAGPCLRLHDLFRDFLAAELRRRLPGELKALHARAAAAEADPARAVQHHLAAEDWERATALVLSLGERLLVQGAVGTVERWIDQLPATIREREPLVGYLRGTCAWLRWDWPRARRELEPAVAALLKPRETAQRVRASFQLVDALNSSGEPALAWARLEEVAQLPLDTLGQAELALQRAWCLAPAGELARIEHHMREFIAHVERDPARICPPIAPRIHCILIGLPGVSAVFERFGALAAGVYGPAPAPWHIAGHVIAGWAQLWHGERAAALASLARAEALYHQFGGIRLLGERVAQLRTLLLSAVGEHPRAMAIATAHVEGLQTAEVAGHATVWLRAYRQAVARMAWMAEDGAAWQALVPLLVAPRSAAEWRFTDVAADVVRGQIALARGEPGAALAPLARAVSGYERFRMPHVYPDPRIAFAYALLASGDPRAAWRAFEPVYHEVLGERAYGLLLLDRRAHVDALLAVAPDEVRASDGIARIRAVLDEWRPAGTESRPPVAGASAVAAPTGTAAAGVGPDLPHARRPAPGSRLAELTDRELEVLDALAAGASNKHIARALALSLHTVKRHVANILGKLDCTSRGAAADLYRREVPARPA